MSDFDGPREQFDNRELNTLKDGFDNTEKVEIVHGRDSLFSIATYCMYSTTERIDLYTDKRDHRWTPTVMYADAKKRGVKIRVITEITKENLTYCKENMKYIDDLRHIDNITHTFGVSERHYLSSKLNEDPRLAEGLFSNVKWFVREQQYLFESIWKKAIPAKQRFKEIEEGSKREFIETIRDPLEILELVPQIISSAYEEVMILVPTLNTIKRFNSEGLSQLIKDRISKNEVYAKLIVKKDQIDNTDIISLFELDTQAYVDKQDANSLRQNLELQIIEDLDSDMLIIIIDREKILSIEMRDDSAVKLIDSIGLATYSNSLPTVMSHVSIFETLWIRSEIKEQHKVS